MKNNKRTLALLTAGLLVVTPMAATGLTVFAEGTNKITITSAQAGTHNYKAYQIFKGNLYGAGTDANPYVLTELQWGDNVTGADFLTALQADNSFLIDHDNNSSTAMVNAFASAASAEDVAGVLEKYADNSDFAVAFAKFAGNHLNSTAAAASDNTADSSNSKLYELDNLAAGYYLVKDEADITQDTPRTLNMLKVAGTVTIDTKEDKPTLTKKITASNQTLDGVANTASFGDIVDYQIKSKVPKMNGYEKYFFIVNDTMESGLTFNPSSVAIKIMNGETLVKTLVADTDYYLKQSSDASPYTFQIVFKNFAQYNNATYVGKDIIIDYNATVNENATIGNTTELANTNTANLTYSNNPNEVSTGIPADGTNPAKPDEPKPSTPDDPNTTEVNEYKPGDPVGETPIQTTYTYLTNLIIEKVDKANTSTKLSGAKFELTGESINVTYHEGKVYKKNNSATSPYYLLKDGTYTNTVPGGVISSDKYVSTTQKYELVDNATAISSIDKVTAYGTSGADGKITFSALGVGTYTIIETKAPDGGYNKLESPITVSITATPSADGCTWKYNTNDSNVVQVLNAKGSHLPSTGGMGTRLFYIIGGLLVAGSLVLLVTKKRMSKEN